MMFLTANKRNKRSLEPIETSQNSAYVAFMFRVETMIVFLKNFTSLTSSLTFETEQYKKVDEVLFLSLF